MQWLGKGLKLLPYVVEAVRMVERLLVGKRGQEKEDAAVGMVQAILTVVELGVDRDLLSDPEVEQATRKVMQAVVALENIISAKMKTSSDE